MRSARTQANAPAPDPLSESGPHSTTGAFSPVGPVGPTTPLGAVGGTGAADQSQPVEAAPTGAIGAPFLRWESLPDEALDQVHGVDLRAAPGASVRDHNRSPLRTAKAMISA